MKILIVLTSHKTFGDAGLKTGFWLAEFAAPYYVFKDAGAAITLASPKGGKPPLDPRCDLGPTQSEAARRFRNDPEALALLESTVPLADVVAEDFGAAFYAGGHGPLFDLAEDPFSIALIETLLSTGKPVALVCHTPGVLRHVKTPEGGPMVENKSVTGFANTEEADSGLSLVVPFLVEDMLKDQGGKYTKAANWEPHVVTDGLLITGQNPASAELAAAALLKRLNFFSPPGFLASIPWNAS